MYTIKGYKNNLTQEHISLLEKLFIEISNQDEKNVEAQLLNILKWLLTRNPEGQEIIPGDFSLIMLILSKFDFETEYWTWSNKREKFINLPFHRYDTKFLLSCCRNKKSMEILLEEIFLYLEHDVYKPSNILIGAIEEYEKKGTIDTIYKEDYLYRKV